jgi:uncharacterized protein YjbI with pentapeptide repeats
MSAHHDQSASNPSDPDRPAGENTDDDSRWITLEPERLNAILAAHQLWLASAGQEGARAALRRVDLSATDLQGADLRHADLRETRLERTQLQRAALDYADLSGATGLLPAQLAGADLSGAILPGYLDLSDRLGHIEDITVGGGKMFFVMLLAVGYTWLTIATTSDVDLLTNSSTSPLPIILTELPISGFYWAAPLILFGLYVYFHLHLQRLWEELTALPALFPDGRTAYHKAHPWLLTGLVNAHCKNPPPEKPVMSRAQNFISIVLAWYLIPLTIAALWVRYLPRHDWPGTGFHLIILMLTVVGGIISYRLAIATLEGLAGPPLILRRLGDRKRDKLLQLTEILLLAMTFLVLPLLSFGLMSAGPQSTAIDPRIWAPAVFAALGYSPFANFRGREVSSRPDDWSDTDPPIARVKGADLRGVDLYRASAAGAFLAKADLREANLQSADLELADLRGARLQDANLRQASLLHADLRESNLAGANLRQAVLLRANLEAAQLRRANLSEAFLNQANLQSADLFMADLRGAWLNNADLRGANLALTFLGGANLEGADLRNATGLDCVQLETVVLDDGTRLPNGPDCPELRR